MSTWYARLVIRLGLGGTRDSYKAFFHQQIVIVLVINGHKQVKISIITA